jgi:hypothetical protein
MAFAIDEKGLKFSAKGKKTKIFRRKVKKQPFSV